MKNSSWKSVVQKSDELNATIKTLKQKMQEELHPAFAAFVQENPDVVAVKWTQYTPYFNDGDTCYFRANEPYFKFKGMPEEMGYNEDGFVELPHTYGYSNQYNEEEYTSIWNNVNKTLYKNCKEFVSFLNNNEDALETIFGDHVEVTVTAEGVFVEEYDHE